jgi:biopolymer transport protein ExbD
MKLRKKHKEEAELHVGPLNDILFILLLFFLIVSTLANPNVVRVNNPKGKSDTKASHKITISVDSTNKMYVNQTPVPKVDSLEGSIAKEWYKDTTVRDLIINGDIKARYGEVMEVLRIAKKMNFKVAVNVAQQ